MRYKVCYAPYFYVEADSRDEAAKKALKWTVNIQGAARPPQGILVNNKPPAERIEVFIFDVREEPGDGGQTESEGQAGEEVAGAV